MEIKRLSNPAYSKNAFLYNLGLNVLKQKYGKKPSIKEYRNLLENPTLPSDLIKTFLIIFIAECCTSVDPTHCINNFNEISKFRW
jgi:hypothetical protein